MKLVSHHGDCSSAVAMWIFLSAQAEKQGLEPGSVGSTGPLFNHTPALEFEFEKVYSHIRLFGSFSPFQPRFASSSCSFFIWTFFVAILRRLTCSVCHIRTDTQICVQDTAKPKPTGFLRHFISFFLPLKAHQTIVPHTLSAQLCCIHIVNT